MQHRWIRHLSTALVLCAGAAQAQSAPPAAHPAIPPEVAAKLRAELKAECLQQTSQVPQAERREQMRLCAEAKREQVRAKVAACEQQAQQQPQEQRASAMRQCLSAARS